MLQFLGLLQLILFTSQETGLYSLNISADSLGLHQLNTMIFIFILVKGWSDLLLWPLHSYCGYFTKYLFVIYWLLFSLFGYMFIV